MRNPEVVILVVLSCILTFLPVLAPASGLMLSILTPFPLIVLGVKYPWHYVLGVLAFQTVILLVAQGLGALFVLTYYVVVPLVMAAKIRLGATMTQTILYSVGIPTVLSLLLLGLYSLSQNQSPSALLTQYFEDVLQGVADSAAMSAGSSVNQTDDLAAAIKAIPNFVLSLLPAMLVINYLLTNVLNYGVVYWYCKRGQPSLEIPTETFATWRVPDYLIWVFIGSGIMLLLPSGFLSQVGLNVLIVTLALYLLQGIAIVAFWAQRLPLPLGARWLLTIFILLFAAPLFLVACTAAGLFDLWVDFRRQSHNPIAP